MSGHTRWLLTVGTDVELRRLADELHSMDVDIDNVNDAVGTDAALPGTPLGTGEMVIACRGPADLPDRLMENPHPHVRSVHLDSDLELF